MAGDRCTVSQMADVIMEGLEEYAQLAADDMKKAVKKAGAQARKDIQENAPVKTGAYAKSWAAKTTKETANAMEIVVHSRNRYQLAHLLEFGHALRKGGRTRAFPHIAPAEERAAQTLEREVEKALSIEGRHTYLYAPADGEAIETVVKHLHRAGLVVLLLVNEKQDKTLTGTYDLVFAGDTNEEEVSRQIRTASAYEGTIVAGRDYI